MSTHNKVKALKEYLSVHGKSKKWSDLADEFGVFQERSVYDRGEAVRSIYRNIKRHKRNLEKKLILKSKWQSASGEWLESYKVNNDTSIISTFKEFKDEFISELKSLNTNDISIKHKPKNSGILYEINIPDFHFGSESELTIEEQSKLFLDSINRLTSRIKSFDVEKIVFPIGNDILNSDTIDYTTTKGTPQRDNSHWQESFRVAWITIIKAIEMLKQICTIDVIIVQGNHDWMKSFYLGDVITAYFHNDNNVFIDNSINSPRKYYMYKNVLIGYTHGDNEKLRDLPLIMATECPDEWANTKHREFHTGHLHSEGVIEIQGTIVRTFSSLVTRNEWHKKMGYNSYRKAQAFLWGEDGLIGYFQENY